jgi:hypothetical protein
VPVALENKSLHQLASTATMNYVNFHVTCEKKYRSSRSIIKNLGKNRVVYEKIEKIKKFKEVKLRTVHLLPQLNNSYPYTLYKFVFFLCIQHFCTWFCHRPIVAAVGRALTCHTAVHPRPATPQPRLTATSHTM